ncbi:hypothetical protein [Bifidobacterium myosotis]|uniref:Uncharacterized protein n=1 Tax=Bifidobacterium myosotis TaxID=1630166 RepID=A0A5M9ZGA7_9BIFI|nr:hypothetical protein [Bifidobacterium myosotis]KAA8825099.1 hypothetical protein EMO91_12790 [Bifidobacterium myosotis]
MDPHALRILMALEHDLAHDAFLMTGIAPAPADYGAPTPAGRALDRLLDADRCAAAYAAIAGLDPAAVRARLDADPAAARRLRRMLTDDLRRAAAARLEAIRRLSAPIGAGHDGGCERSEP